MSLQKTIRKAVTVKGAGLHGGRAVSVCMRPAAENTGVIFARIDIGGRPEIRAGMDRLVGASGSPRRTSVSDGRVRVETIEHVMAALNASGIDNVRIELDGTELPALDGSALGYAKVLRDAGTTELGAPRRVWAVAGEVRCEANGATITAYPDESMVISYELGHRAGLLPDQKVRFIFTEAEAAAVFENEVAPSRTFCLRSEVEAVRAMGLGRGGTTRNTLILDGETIIDNTLRFVDEFARHKVLDIMGDIFLLGGLFKGRIEAVKSGHALNYELLYKLTGSGVRPRLC